MHNPLFIELSEKLKRRISDEADAHHSDWNLPTLNELAKEYKTSLVTAKKAVDVLSMEGLTTARPGIGITVNSEILKERKGQITSLSIGVIFLDIFDMNSLVISDIIQGIVDVQQKVRFQLKFIPIPSDQPLENQMSVLENVLSGGVNGIIIASRMPLGIISGLQEKNVKFVWVNNNIPHEKIYSVMFDTSDMYLKIIRRIKELRFSKAAFIAPVISMEESNTFVKLCGNSGISLKTFTCDTLKQSEEVRNIAIKDTLKLLSASDDKPEIIIGGGEIAAMGILQAVFSKGLKVPDDVYIMAVAEQESLKFRLPVPIDIVLYSFFDIAREAMLMLLEILENKSPEARIKYLSCKLLATPKSEKDKEDTSK